MSHYIVGLTGGIASGKSSVAALFAGHGIAVADADRIAREVVEPGQPALAAIAAHFGAGVLQADGRLDRAALRRIVFADAGARRGLEAITHPAIRSALKLRCEQADSAYAIADIPLLAEAGRAAYPWLDRVLVVDVPATLQLARLQARDGIDLALAQSMLAAQATREQRLAAADDVLDNSGALEQLPARVEALHRQYLALAAMAAAR